MKTIAILVVTAVVSFLAGVALERSRATGGRSRGRTALPPPSNAAPSVERELHREEPLSSHQSTPAPILPSLPPKQEPDRFALARELWGFFRKLDTTDEAEELPEDANWFKTFGKIDDLDEESAAFFAERYHLCSGREEKGQALFLACACGGPVAAALLKEVLSDSALSEEERSEAISQLHSAQLLSSRMSIPVDEELGAIAAAFLASPDPKRRAGGAAILAGDPSPRSLVRLRSLAETDPDMAVRVAAVDTLGRAGDRSTMEILRTYRIDPADPGARSLDFAVKNALVRLSRRFPK